MKVTSCRLCKGLLSEPVLSLPDTPLANEFLTEKKVQDTFPLRVCTCTVCGHFQLDEKVEPERLFRNYLFVAGTSPVNVKHFKDYAESIMVRFKLPKGSKVLDIASNDGTLLKEFKSLGMNVLGVDPAVNIATKATSEGIETLAEFFTENYAENIKQNYGLFNLVTANNVFAHVPDLEDFARGVKKVLVPGGIFVFEVSYFLDVCDKVLVDTLYHEHSSYHTINPLKVFFERIGMSLFYVQNIDTHGGSIRVFVKNDIDSSQFEQLLSVRDSKIAKENNILERAGTLGVNVMNLSVALNDRLTQIKGEGKSIAVYGAPAKATTLIYALNINENHIDFAVDDNPLKQGTFTPGKHIPVFDPVEIQLRNPDYILVLAWNFAPSIIEKCRAAGFQGKFIVPLPELIEV